MAPRRLPTSPRGRGANDDSDDDDARSSRPLPPFSLLFMPLFMLFMPWPISTPTTPLTTTEAMKKPTVPVAKQAFPAGVRVG